MYCPFFGYYQRSYYYKRGLKYPVAMPIPLIDKALPLVIGFGTLVIA
jgi:hypothetical protein